MFSENNKFRKFNTCTNFHREKVCDNLYYENTTRDKRGVLLEAAIMAATKEKAKLMKVGKTEQVNW